MGLIVYGGDSPAIRAQEVNIRKDNDFRLIFIVERNGKPEDMEKATIVSLDLITPSATLPLTPVSIEKNIIYLDMDKSINQVLGKYRMELKYTVPDIQFTGGVRDCAIDVYAYTIVSSTSEATKIDELAKSVDVATGFQGKAFTWDMYTPEQIAELKRPALEAALEANAAAQSAESAASQALQAKNAANTAAQSADTATGHANAAATNANTEAGKATEAASSANAAASDAYQKAVVARQEAEGAQRAASAADQARISLAQSFQTELAYAEQKLLEVDQAKAEALGAATEANTAAQTATTQGNLAESKAEIAKDAADHADQARTALVQASDSKIAEMNQVIQTANYAVSDAETATGRANAAADNADTATSDAQDATEDAIAATNMVLANMVKLELRDDMCLWMITPDTYQGVTFKVDSGDLIAVIQ